LADDLFRLAHKEMPARLKSLQAIETDHIIRVLEETNWRIDGAKGAAVILDMNPSTLRSRLRKLGIKKTKRGFKGSGFSVQRFWVRRCRVQPSRRPKKWPV